MLWRRVRLISGAERRFTSPHTDLCDAAAPRQKKTTRPMPWNDNANPGPWGSPSNGEGDKGAPRGGGPRGPRGPDRPEMPPGLEQLLKRLRDMFGGSGGRMGSGALAVIVAVALGLWVALGVYIVRPNELAVVLRFGKFARLETPGLRVHLPVPVETVEIVPVTNLNKTDIGLSSDTTDASESLMLTSGDEIVDLKFSVTWRISDAKKYAFTVRDQEDAVKSVAESAMREVIGKTDPQAVLMRGRGEVQLQVAQVMQKVLDRWDAGVRVVEVQITSANPPTEVVDAFRQLQNAGQDAQSKVNEANTYRNRVVNEAKGDAAKLTQSAEAYREQSVREAIGETARFNQIYGEYRKAPGVTRQRLYVETMERVLAKSNKVMVDGKGTTAPIILPPDVFRPRAAATRPASTVDDGGSQSGDQAVTGAAK